MEVCSVFEEVVELMLVPDPLGGVCVGWGLVVLWFVGGGVGRMCSWLGCGACVCFVPPFLRGVGFRGAVFVEGCDENP